MFEDLYNIINNAKENGVLMQIKDLTGLSGSKLIGVLQRLSAYQERNDGGSYLEIGTFQGLTLLSVAKILKYENAFGIDNFSQFDSECKNQQIIKNRMNSNNITNAILINEDFEDALDNLEQYIGKKKIGVYFVDGPHDYRSQFMCLGLAKPYLSDSAIIVIDDCNYPHVRQATRDFLICNPEFKLFFEAYTECHPGNMTKVENNKAMEGWWNGVNILVIDRENILDKVYPPTITNRILFENEHIIHAAKYAVIAPQAVRIISELAKSKIYNYSSIRKILNLVKKARALEIELVGDYETKNTFSANLPKEKFNYSIK